ISSLIPPPPRSTLFPYTTLFRSEIGVHIADVSHYVRPGTRLDDEAYSRATSIYLVDRVVPMLLEVLSNGVCSLRPNEDKYTFSRSEEHTSELQSRENLVCRLLLE